MLHIDESKLQKLLLDLISISSINPAFTDNINDNEMKIAKFIKNWLLEHNVTAKIEMVEENRPNVVAKIGNSNGKPTICLCAHIDTVGINDMEIEPLNPTVDGNNIYGRGSCDMKAGIASIMMTAAIIENDPNFDGELILALVCDEEYRSIGAEDFVKNHHADVCILTEPSDLKLVVAHKGYLWGELKVQGKSAHGSRWDIGESAITNMSQIIQALDHLDKEVLRSRVDELTGPASMHVGVISGGEGVSIYAPSCTIQFERRTLPNENLEDVKKEIEDTIGEITDNYELNWYFSRNPFQSDSNSEITKVVSKSIEKFTGDVAEKVGWGFWTDAAIFQQAGIETVNIGAVGHGLHEEKEWVEFDSVVTNTKILIDSVRKYCG